MAALRAEQRAEKWAGKMVEQSADNLAVCSADHWAASSAVDLAWNAVGSKVLRSVVDLARSMVESKEHLMVDW